MYQVLYRRVKRRGSRTEGSDPQTRDMRIPFSWKGDIIIVSAERKPRRHDTTRQTSSLLVRSLMKAAARNRGSMLAKGSILRQTTARRTAPVLTMIPPDRALSTSTARPLPVDVQAWRPPMTKAVAAVPSKVNGASRVLAPRRPTILPSMGAAPAPAPAPAPPDSSRLVEIDEEHRVDVDGPAMGESAYVEGESDDEFQSPISLMYTEGRAMPIVSRLHIVSPDEDTPRGTWPVFRLMVRRSSIPRFGEAGATRDRFVPFLSFPHSLVPLLLFHRRTRMERFGRQMMRRKLELEPTLAGVFRRTTLRSATTSKGCGPSCVRRTRTTPRSLPRAGCSSPPSSSTPTCQQGTRCTEPSGKWSGSRRWITFCSTRSGRAGSPST
jgi:hypothetical protein